MSHHEHNSQTGFPLAAKTGCSHLVKFHFFLLFARWPRLLQQLFMKIKAIPYRTIPSSHLWTRVSAKFGVHQLCIVNCKRHCHCQSMFWFWSAIITRRPAMGSLFWPKHFSYNKEADTVMSQLSQPTVCLVDWQIAVGIQGSNTSNRKQLAAIFAP